MTVVTDPRCERTDLPASMCSHCRGLPWNPPTVDDRYGYEDVTFDPAEPASFTRPVVETGTRRRSFHAEFESSCPSCGEQIRPGDRIVRERDGHRYVCEECADNDGRLA